MFGNYFCLCSKRVRRATKCASPRIESRKLCPMREMAPRSTLLQVLFICLLLHAADVPLGLTSFNFFLATVSSGCCLFLYSTWSF